jgi:DNA-binding response OmpR family regulator
MMPIGRILLVDDEKDLVWAVQHSLYDEDYEVFTASDGLEAIAIAQAHHPDVIVLDILMPCLDGLQVCQRLRWDPALARVPILFLSVRNTVEDRIKGLDAGSDDYLAKPFDLGELKARIRALLRRDHPVLPAVSSDVTGQNVPLKIGQLTLNACTCLVTLGKKMIQLTQKEFDLLYYLVLHSGEAFSSQQLLQQVWGYPPAIADPSLVRWHIKNLRFKIEPDPENPVYICNQPRHGYFFKQQRACRRVNNN